MGPLGPSSGRTAGIEGAGLGRAGAGLTGPQGEQAGTGSFVGRRAEGASTDRRLYSIRRLGQRGLQRGRRRVP